MLNQKIGKRIVSSLLILSFAFVALGCGEKDDFSEIDSEMLTYETDSAVIESEEAEESRDACYITADDVRFSEGFVATETDSTVYLSADDESIAGDYFILVNEETGEIVCERNAYEKIYPASMTKVLTLLVAAEQCENLYDDVTITWEATNYSYANDCSNAYLLVGDVFTVKDLMYMTILPSGGDAAMSLALYTSGSMEAFVELMNEKVEELGLSETSHFTNPVGIYDDDLYTTAYDMSMIMKAAIENETCREILGKHIFTHSPMETHEDGLVYSNLFLRRIEDHIQTGTVLGAKTGYVNEAGSCAVSYEISNSNTPYICVVAHSTSSWGCIFDHVALYDTYAP